MHELKIQSQKPFESIELTDALRNIVESSGMENGVVHVYSTHTTAAIVVNENADGGRIWRDLDELLDTLAPADNSYHHSDGNGQAHLKTMLLGCEKTIPVRDSQLALGRWQGVYLVELDGPRERIVMVTLVPAL